MFLVCAAQAAGIWPTSPGFSAVMDSRQWQILDNPVYRQAAAWAAGQVEPLPPPMQDHLVYKDVFPFVLR
jgi:hypothetical protein